MSPGGFFPSQSDLLGPPVDLASAGDPWAQVTLPPPFCLSSLWWQRFPAVAHLWFAFPLYLDSGFFYPGKLGRQHFVKVGSAGVLGGMPQKLILRGRFARREFRGERVPQ